MRYCTLLIFLFLSASVIADVPPAQKIEVNHLLIYIGNSNCILNRNGSEHSGKKAVKHIKNKYDYFVSDIKNTEDFIKYSATKSTMSGIFCKVNCPGKKTIMTKTWLLDELKRYRETEADLLINTE